MIKKVKLSKNLNEFFRLFYGRHIMKHKQLVKINEL
jgi:hypothetical protein